jgi:hypothetical protein
MEKYGAMAIYSVTRTESFQITGGAGTVYYGGDQHWLSKDFKKEAACGATTCSNIMAYFARTRDGYAALCPCDLASKDGFIHLMEEMYGFVKPGMIGIMPGDFIKGATDYGASKGYAFTTVMLAVPGPKRNRPEPSTAARFIRDSLSADIPVAFLNLSSGRIRNLDSYHWVTIVGFDDATGKADIVDNGRLLTIEVLKWIKKTSMGGAFVRIEPETERT